MVQSKQDDWERFGRASVASALPIIELNTWRSNPKQFDQASYYGQIMIHRAHSVMLAEEKIISREEGYKIIEGIKKVENEEKRLLKNVGYMSTETALINLIGEIGGKMHIGRSRNDLGHTQRRIFYRDQIIRIINSITQYRKSLLSVSEQNIETVMPGYTHWRQAQPTTLAHYLLGHVEAAGRMVERLEGIYGRTNISPLGSAAFSGTGWPINRERTMSLLGFDNLLENSHDGVSTIDYFMELSSGLSIHMSNLSRLAEDIQIWSSDEFKLIELAEEYAGTSSIMPQKKNPLILEQLKGYTSECIGAMASVFTSMKGTSYTNIVDRVMLEPIIIDTVVGCTNIMSGVVQTLEPLKDIMLRHLRDGFSTMTDLADNLVRAYNLSFRQAHDIIVHVTVEALKKDMKAMDITPDMIAKASQIVVGKRIKIPVELVQQSTDPLLNIKRRKVLGGPAPESVRKMIENQHEKLLNEEKRNSVRSKKIKKALRNLEKAEKSLED
jgi:argininosuccinate lyase